MTERDITSVVWHERHHRIDVIYVEGDSDRLWGSEAVAVVLAKNAGLSAVNAPVGTREWVRDPDEA
jgi:hypothetical protein